MPTYSFGPDNPVRLNIPDELAAAYNRATQKIIFNGYAPGLSVVEESAYKSVGELISRTVWEDLMKDDDLYEKYLNDMDFNPTKYLVPVAEMVSATSGFRKALGIAAGVGMFWAVFVQSNS